MLSHRNLTSMIAIFNRRKDITSFSNDDVHLSYLPLPHLYERAIYLVLLLKGANIFFYSGDIFKLADDLSQAKPTFFATVPRLHLRFHDVIKNKF